MPLHDDLLATARRFAGSGVDHLHDDALEMTLVHLSVACELVLKAELAGRNPAFIADPKHFDAAAALSGQSRADGKQTKMRTIGAQEALNRVRIFEPQIVSDLEAALLELFAVRNGTVHLGSVADADRAERLLSAAASLVHVLVDDDDAFWGEHSDLARGWRDEQRSRIAQTVLEREGRARRVLSKRTEGMTDSEIGLRKSQIGAGLHIGGNDLVLGCPVCGTDGVVGGMLLVSGLESPGREEFEAQLVPDRFTCRLCDFHLDSPAQIAAASIPEAIEIPDADPEDFVEDYNDQGAADWHEHRDAEMFNAGLNPYDAYDRY